MRRLRAAGPALVIEGGSALFESEQVAIDDRRARSVAEGIAAAAGRMGVDAWVPGRTDLALGLDTFDGLMRRHAIPVVAANLRRRDGSMPFPSHVTRQLGGVRIVVVGLVGQPWPAASGLEATDPVKAAQQVAASAVGADDMLVLVTQQGLDAAKQLVQRVPRANAVLVADPRSFTFLPSEVVRDRRRPVDTAVPLVAAGRHGQYLVRFDLSARAADPVWRNAEGPVPAAATRYRFRFVDVDATVEEDADTARWRAALPATAPAVEELPLEPGMR